MLTFKRGQWRAFRIAYTDLENIHVANYSNIKVCRWNVNSLRSPWKLNKQLLAYHPARRLPLPNMAHGGFMCVRIDLTAPRWRSPHFTTATCRTLNHCSGLVCVHWIGGVGETDYSHYWQMTSLTQTSILFVLTSLVASLEGKNQSVFFRLNFNQSYTKLFFVVSVFKEPNIVVWFKLLIFYHCWPIFDFPTKIKLLYLILC